MRLKLLLIGLTLPTVLALDFVTKSWALRTLVSGPRELFGGLVPLTLAFNKGAAFGISVGDDSRWLFVPITFVALGLLGVLFKQAHSRDVMRIAAISLVVSGALGNLYDRLRWSRGVVDFIGPIDLVFWHFPIFNVADIAITCGAILLAISFWLEERRLESEDAVGVAAAEERAGGLEPQGLGGAEAGGPRAD